MAIEAKLIDGWRQAWKLWSVRLNALGIASLGYLTLAPDVALEIFNALPIELREMLPPFVANLLPIALFVAAIVARLFKQKGVTQ